MNPMFTRERLLPVLRLLMVALLGVAESLAQPTGTARAVVAPVAEAIAVRTGEPPAWVEARSWASPELRATAGVPAEILLHDRQDVLGDAVSSYYNRMVVLLRNAEGVRRYAEWTVDYAPEYESIQWHSLRIHRSGQETDRLASATFRKLQREQSLENRVFDGRITIATVLEDVRVGDVVEVSYTLTSGNPALQGHLGTRHYLGSPYPVRIQHVVVRAPMERQLHASFFLPDGTQNLPPELYRLSLLRLGLQMDESQEQRSFRWIGENLPAIPFDERIAPRASPYYPMLRISSFGTWAEVNLWAQGLFSKAGPLPPESIAWVERCKREIASPRARLVAAVAWVQQEIRYFAMSIGAQNLRPRPLAEVCATRFGDCKDKSALLVAILRELGFEAWPALVNTLLKERVREHGPGPYAFDHAIVVYRLDGQDHWIDPTLEHQKGGPGTWAVPPYRSGLILREGEEALSELPSDPAAHEPDSITEDMIKVASDGDATLAVSTRLRGLQADQYRHFLSATDAGEVALRWLNYLSRFYRAIEEVAPLQIRDDSELNIITLTGSYRLPGFVVADGSQWIVSTHAYAIRALIDPPESRRRRWPYALPGDRFVRHRVVVDLPFELSIEQQPQLVVTDELVYRTEKGLTGRRFVSEHELRFIREFVPADGMLVFSESVDEILNSLSTTLRSPVMVTAPAAAAGLRPTGTPSAETATP